MKYQARNNHIINWAEYPMLRISICFILGILISDNSEIPMDLNLNILFALFISFALIMMVFKYTIVIIRLLSFIIFTIGFFIGMVRCDLQNVSNQKFHYLKFKTEENTLIGLVSSELKRKKRCSATINVKQIDGRNCSGKMLVYFSAKDSISYKKGDVISFNGRILEIKPNANPYTFDYKSHLKYKGVNAQIFLKDNQHFFIHDNGLNTIEKLARTMRFWALFILEKRLTNKDQLATASAMVLGYRAHLSDDLYESFSETGAVHVLAVSGLHVGIICMIFIAFFNFFEMENTTLKIIKLSTLLCVVWTYALVTGGSPAVLRAAVMFSLILIGRLWFKGVNVYNILAFSALLLLFYNPYLLFQLSFQFSYLALISIIFFQPKIERLVDIRNRFSIKLWQLTTVSIAAQILVFPISVFFFHKLPIYFILSGVSAVFLATFVLGIGLLLLCFDSVPIIGDLITLFYSKLLELFLNIISGIQALPFNTVDGIYLSGFSMILLYILIGAIMLLLSFRPKTYKDILYKKLKRKKGTKIIVAICIIFLFFNNLCFTYRTKNIEELIIYDVSKNTLIDIFWHNNLYNLRSENLDESSMNFSCDGYRIYNGLPKLHDLNSIDTVKDGGLFFDKNGGLKFKNTQIIIVDRLNMSDPFLKKSDVVFVVNNTDLLPYDFLAVHDTSLVVLDNSLSYKVKNQWRKECQKQGIPIHDVRIDGVFTLK